MLSRSWTPEEDRILLQLVAQCKKTGMTRVQTFEVAGERLGRSSNACYLRWKSVTSNRKGVELDSAPHRKRCSEMVGELMERIEGLEQRLDENHAQVRQWIRESQKMREEMKFFETLLLEEYQLLLTLLNKNKPSARLHQLD
jgi:RsfA family transcription factor